MNCNNNFFPDNFIKMWAMGCTVNDTVKQHFSACDKFMRICQNRPIDKFMWFLFMYSSTLCIVTYASTNLCNRNLTRIIRINKSHAEICHFTVFTSRGSRSLQNLVAIFQRYYRPVLTSKAGCIRKYGKNWLLNSETSSHSEGYSSKWLIWLVYGEPL